MCNNIILVYISLVWKKVWRKGRKKGKKEWKEKYVYSLILLVSWTLWLLVSSMDFVSSLYLNSESLLNFRLLCCPYTCTLCTGHIQNLHSIHVATVITDIAFKTVNLHCSIGNSILILVIIKFYSGALEGPGTCKWYGPLGY